jgi:hypothetical protein
MMSAEFLQLVRNLSEPLRPIIPDSSYSGHTREHAVSFSADYFLTNGGVGAQGDVSAGNALNSHGFSKTSFWSAQEVGSISLESDADALEFLQQLNYNVDAAWFSLSVHLGRGRGKSATTNGYLVFCHNSTLTDWICTRRSQSFVDRLAPNLIYSECKDKLLRPGDRLNILLGDVTERERDRDKDRDGRLQSAMNSLYYFPDPLHPEEDSPSPTTSALAASQDSPIKPSLSQDENADTLVQLPSTADKELAASTAIGHTKSSRIANNDKNEARKKWTAIHSRASALMEGLAQTHSSTSSSNGAGGGYSAGAAGNTQSKTVGGKNPTSKRLSGSAAGSVPVLSGAFGLAQYQLQKMHLLSASDGGSRPTVEEVQDILDDSVAIPQQIVTLCSNKADEELAESLRSVLGDLIKVGPTCEYGE